MLLDRLLGRRTEVTRAGAYELRVRVRRVGTRSEGRTGRLFHEGAEIRGREGETVRAGPDGPVFLHVGDRRPHLWSTSGWTIAASTGG